MKVNTDKSSKGELIEQTTTQEGPRHCQDDGPGEHGSGTPSVWGKADFTVGKSPAASTSGPNVSVGVDLETGKITGGKPVSVVKEVPKAY
jgi:hypothetical protein